MTFFIWFMSLILFIGIWPIQADPTVTWTSKNTWMKFSFLSKWTGYDGCFLLSWVEIFSLVHIAGLWVLWHSLNIFFSTFLTGFWCLYVCECLLTLNWILKWIFLWFGLVNLNFPIQKRNVQFHVFFNLFSFPKFLDSFPK